MNLNKTLVITNDKLSTSCAHKNMNDFMEQINVYPPNVVVCKKEKRAKLVESFGSKVWKECHGVFISTYNNFSSSVVLIQNDQAVEHMVNEAAEFAYKLNLFYERLKQPDVTATQELHTYYKKVFNLKPKTIKSALIADLKGYAEMYGFSIDNKAISSKFDKQFKVLCERCSCTN